MKSIILAGGLGSRLSPLTLQISKQLLPVYNKPMIYYPLSLMILAGIKEFALISTPQYLNSYKRLLGSGKEFGIKIEYFIQKKPNGLPEAFKICKDFINNKPCSLILGDNIFFGSNFHNIIHEDIKTHKSGARIYLYKVSNPTMYGICKIKNNSIKQIIEKPKYSKSNFAITGLYLFDEEAVEKATKCKISIRGETEIVDMLKIYLKEKSIKYSKIGRGISWFDSGSFNDLLACQELIKAIEERQQVLIGSPHEAAYRNGNISRKNIIKFCKNNFSSSYFKNLKNILY